MKRATPLLGLMLVLGPAWAACGSASGRGAPHLERAQLPGVEGRRCHYVNSRDDLPPPSDLVRPGTRGSIALWGRDMGAGDSVVLSIRYGDEGGLAWIRALHASIDSERVARLEDLLQASLHLDGPQDWGVRVRVAGGDLAGVEPSIVCPADVRRGFRNPVALPTTSRDYHILNQARGREYPVLIALDERGGIMDVRLERPSGQYIVDQFIRDWVFATSFFPKLHDGIPVATVIRKTLYLPRRRP